MSELSSASQGTSRIQYEQHPPTRDITGNNFPNGAIHIRWQTAGQKWWIPSRSYIRMRCEISKPNGQPLELKDNIAPNMGLCANLFQSLEFRINDKTISRVSDYVPQVDALNTRLNKSRAWLEGAGASLNYWQDDIKERQAQVCEDGILVDKSLGNVPQAQDIREALGLDAVGGNGVDKNAASYVEATGIITFAQNGGAALPGDIRDVFPVGSYIQYTAIRNAPPDDARLNKPALVVEGLSSTTIRVARSVIGADVVVDGRTDFVRVRSPSQVNVARKTKSVELLWQPPPLHLWRTNRNAEREIRARAQPPDGQPVPQASD